MCVSIYCLYSLSIWGEGFLHCVWGGGGGGLMYLVPTACYVLPIHRVLGPFEACEKVANNRKFNQPNDISFCCKLIHCEIGYNA